MKTIREVLLDFYGKDEADAIIAREFSRPDDAVSSAWYVKVLIGASAWFASLSFLSAIAVFLGTVKSAGIVIGIMLCVAAGILNHFYNNKIFIQQFALSLCLAGQAAATVYFAESAASHVSTLLFSIIISAVIAAAYRYSVMRFIAMLVLVGSVILLMEETGLRNGVPVLVVLLAAAAYVLWMYESFFAASPMAALLRTCAYAITCSLLLVPVLSTFNFFNRTPPSWVPATIGVALIFIVAQGKMLLSFNKTPFSRAFIASSVLTAALSAITSNSPGIVTTLYVMTLGFFRGNRVVTALAGFSLGAYIFMFYYNLSLPLIHKSYILMGSGALLVAAWAALTRLKGGVAK